SADLCRVPMVSSERRFLFTKAWWEARRLAREQRMWTDTDTADDTQRSALPHVSRRERLARERAYFRRFHPAALLQAAGAYPGELERQRDRRHPISRWYLLPTLDRGAAALASTAVRPWHLTV